ncbi:serine/threonine-protein kinase PBL27-like [Vigna unguiculata]|nr:serine/threonine-protein kinase PBL27-like [Vigna unguiculata]
MLSPLHHQNLVTLIGYCCEPDHWLLVYEYMPLGSLENHLFDLHPSREPLDWNTRMKIASGVAKGLEYLHILGDRPAIFGDFKSSNILLGEGYHPKLSDIRMANFGRLCNSSDASTSVGTYGYCAPEYVVTGHLTPECNVYAFGMVLLELISGVKAIDKSRSPEPYHKWAQPIFKDSSELYRLVDPLLDGSYPVAWLHGVIGVADMCLHEDADRRPVIREVVSALTYLESEYNDPEKQCNRRGSKPPTFFYSSLRIKESGLEKEQKKQEFQGGICRYAADTGKRIVRIHNRMRPF